MARPRVFVSSTYYDLKHIRASLALFVESLGFDSILSEKGNVPYLPDNPLDQSCYQEVEAADIFVLIVGGRYGSPASAEPDADPDDSMRLYDSITRLEFARAIAKDIPVYVLVESAVYAEYRTYQNNVGSDVIKYAHVDSPNVYGFLSEILGKKRNNPVYPFDRFSDIETWLREQWAGLFRELLSRRSHKKQIGAISEQIAELKATVDTLKQYAKLVADNQDPEKSREILKEEEVRDKARQDEQAISELQVSNALLFYYRVSPKRLLVILKESENWNSFVQKIRSNPPQHGGAAYSMFWRDFAGNYLGELATARAIVSMPPFDRDEIQEFSRAAWPGRSEST